MGKHSKKYALEFKEQAVQLAMDMGSARRAADKLGIPEANIHNWRKKFEKLKPVKAAETPEEENKRLRKEVDELKKVNYILKRAAAFFSQDQLK